MLSIDFASLANSYPELGSVWHALEEWVHAHPSASYIDTRILAREIQMEPLNPRDLTLALTRMKHQAQLRQVYRVFDPRTNQFLRGEWTAYDAVPEKIQDAFDNYLDIDDLRIVPILKQR